MRCARWRWTPSSRRNPAIPACRWAWPTSPPSCSRNSCSSTRRRPTGRTATGSCCRTAMARCCSTGCCYLTGYPDMTLDELKRFRQLGSRTAGHPERGHASGIETTTGPLGQGLANSVGMALAERHAGRPSSATAVVDHRTYVFAGDGCLMEGISHEALSLAGHLRLNKLIVFCDDNSISIDGPTDPRRLRRPGRALPGAWLGTPTRVDGHDTGGDRRGHRRAHRSDRPTLIACRRQSASARRPRPAPRRRTARRSAPRRSPGRASGSAGRTPPFVIPEEIRAEWRAAGSARPRPCAAPGNSASRRRPAERRAEFLRRQRGELPSGLDPRRQELQATSFRRPSAKIATRQLGHGARGADRGRPRAGRRLCRSHPLEQHQRQGPRGRSPRRLRRPLRPLRHARARHGGGDERHGAAWRHHPLWRHLPASSPTMPARRSASPRSCSSG